GAERIAPATEPQLARSRRAEVPDPVRVAARRDEVSPAVVLEQVHHGRPPGTALPPAHREEARPVEAHAETREAADDPIEERVGEGELHAARHAFSDAAVHRQSSLAVGSDRVSGRLVTRLAVLALLALGCGRSNLVDVRRADPSIRVDMPYATTANFT